tara:strand:- start:44 stop:247 length:204 start_codon:yes stop_codon:yes gene_type:complete
MSETIRDSVGVSTAIYGEKSMTKYKTEGHDGCDDCQWMAQETEGDLLICDECSNEIYNDITSVWEEK